VAEHAAGQRDRDAREEVDADQRAERRVAHAELVEQQGRERGDGLELEADRRAREGEDGQYQPTLRHVHPPTATGGAI
jgi:hypothetical protein